MAGPVTITYSPDWRTTSASIDFLFREPGLRGKERETFLRHGRAVKLRNKLAVEWDDTELRPSNW